MQIKNKKAAQKGGNRMDKRRDNSGLQQNRIMERVGLASDQAHPALNFIKPAYLAASGLVDYQAK